MRKHNMVYSHCVCPICGNAMVVPRIVGRSRKKNHKKDMWCPFCKKMNTMIEIRSTDAYKNMAGELIL